MADHDFSVGRVNVRSGKVVGYVAAMIVRERVLEPPGRPVLDVDDAAHGELLHQRRVVPQVEEGALVRQQRRTVVHQGAIGQAAMQEERSTFKASRHGLSDLL